MMLVHSAVPHHHHLSEICIEICNELSHCATEEGHHNHDDTNHEHDHEHDGNSGTEYCYVNQAFVTPSKNISVNDNFNFIAAELSFLSNFVLSKHEDEKPSRLKLQEHNFTISHNYTSFAPSILGLRGSPVS